MKIDHIAIYAEDMEEMKHFFLAFFGGKASKIYKNKKTGFSSYFIQFEDHTRLELMHRYNVVQTMKTLGYPAGLHHVCFSVGSIEQVDKITALLNDKGYEILSPPRTTGDGYYESCISGPERIIIEITA